MSKIPLFRPSFDEEEVQAVREVLLSGWVGLGPKVKEFESQMAQYFECDSNRVVALNSCTSALDMSMKLLKIGWGDEVIVPAMTFVSTAHAVAFNHATPIFADIDPVTMHIDWNDVFDKVNDRTKAVIPVHYAGRPVEMEEAIFSLTDAGIDVVEDCAHAMGAEYYGKKVGWRGDMACFSTHAIKNLSTGDGGLLVLSDNIDTETVKKARRLTWLGIDKTTWARTRDNKTYWWEYMVNEIGMKAYMNDIAAAIGLVQLRKLDAANRRRKLIAGMYTEAFKGIDIFKTPPDDSENIKSSWHIYCLRVMERRDELSEYLAGKEIETGVHYKPIHLYGCYGNKPHLPVAESVWNQIISLPMYPSMASEDVTRVIDEVITWSEHHV